MGQEKALLTLAGRPLVAHAVTKLDQLCVKVSILSSNPELAAYAPLVADVHPGCGPMSGIEAALLSAGQAWSLILPVDLPFPPAAFLESWIVAVLATTARLALFVVGGRPQPTLLLIHRDLRPYLTEALDAGRFRLYPELAAAAQALGLDTIHRTEIDAGDPSARYFANLNTLEEFQAAEQQVDLLEA